jgi:hypothetical protein
MKTIKVNLHSSVALITNSSTVIFTYSNGCIEPVKDLINEMLNVFDVKDKKADDLFYFGVFLNDYDSFLEENDDEDSFKIIDVEAIIDQVLAGEIGRPDWMIRADEDESYFDGFSHPTSLYIKPKDEKYKALANKLLKYLNSQCHEATRDG